VVDAMRHAKLPAEWYLQGRRLIRCGREESQASREAAGPLRDGGRLAFAIARGSRGRMKNVHSLASVWVIHTTFP
jgi:hypothetical protein